MAFGGGIWSPTGIYSRPDSPEDDDLVRPKKSSVSVHSWNTQNIEEWLAKHNLEKYCSLLKEHQVTSGPVLLQLTEEHLKDMGVTSIGERLTVVSALDRLRVEAGYFPSAKFYDSNHFLEIIEEAKERKCLKMYPKRIILIRHAESVGNVDKSLYANTPDSLLKITELGRSQAQSTGLKLKDLIGSETVSFYVSPFLRSRETCDVIKKNFDPKQIVRCREDPRIREQEWGNFQDPTKMSKVMQERRSIGSFFYRFPTGESGADVYDRVSIFLESMYRDMYKGRCGQNVIIVSHGLFCRLFLTRFYHWPIEYFHRLWNFENCQYAEMRFQEDGYYKLVTELKVDP